MLCYDRSGYCFYHSTFLPCIIPYTNTNQLCYTDLDPIVAVWPIDLANTTRQVQKLHLILPRDLSLTQWYLNLPDSHRWSKASLNMTGSASHTMIPEYDTWHSHRWNKASLNMTRSASHTMIPDWICLSHNDNWIWYLALSQMEQGFTQHD